ncbi:M14 family zinc carboxypeptidase, partial [Nocardioides sp. SYSU D00038]|uniref:M14 family zinc carboxypeptidase n=1 Tax=Nocardioides sp. SYSU D00038 TaxID=2812554 RepID=UPI00196790FA
LVAGLLAAIAPGTATGSPAPASTAAGTAAGAAPAPRGEAVLEVRTIGRSVRGRPIRAWHLGVPDRGKPRVVLLSTMHGDEPATRRILAALRDGRRIHGIDLWVVPVVNPDGLARGTRRNARGVDLNRNFPHRWADLDGRYESGPRPGSEPETRAVMRFLRDVRPDRLLSFHQPLHGVDTDTKSPTFARRVARVLRLPRRSLTCGGVCHGTMTSWYNARFRGAALTVEYGARPSRRLMTQVAPGRVLRVFRAWRAGDRD